MSEKTVSKAIEIFEIISDLEGERDNFQNQNELLKSRISELEQIEIEYNLLLKILSKVKTVSADNQSEILRSSKLFMMDRDGNLGKLG